ncbi:MAG: hypothetical protein MI740_12960 [Halanaerobiales bacterium]|nr:hypothetical protein [Halanaerobiales bacterium]
MLTESLTSIILMSVIVEVVTNAIKGLLPFIKGEKGNGSRITAAIVGITICITTKIGILDNFGIYVAHNLIDFIITGIIISRGSNAIHDIISIFDKTKAKII